MDSRTSTQPGTPTVGALGRGPVGSPETAATEAPRFHFPRKILRWTMILSALPVVICMVFFAAFTQRMIMEEYGRSGDVTTELLASLMTGRLTERWDRVDGEFLDRLTDDSRVAFACVTTPEGRVVHTVVRTGSAWDYYVQHRADSTFAGQLNLNIDEMVDAQRGLVVNSAPIWSWRALSMAHSVWPIRAVVCSPVILTTVMPIREPAPMPVDGNIK